MNKEEFGRWASQLDARFGDRLEWLKKDKSPEQLSLLSAAWFETLEDVSFAGAMEAIRSMHRGDTEFPTSVDFVPKVVRRQALAFENRRPLVEESPPEEYVPRNKRPVTGWALIMHDAAAMLESGKTQAEVQAFLEAKIGSAVEDQRRYNCPQCWDIGMVFVWGNKAIEAILNNEPIPGNYRSCVARCDKCPKGKPRGKLAKECDSSYKGSIETVPAFDPSWMLPVRNNDTTSPEAVGRLQEWVAIMRESKKPATLF